VDWVLSSITFSLKAFLPFFLPSFLPSLPPLLVYLFIGGMEMELRASHLVGRCSTTWATASALMTSFSISWDVCSLVRHSFSLWTSLPSFVNDSFSGNKFLNNRYFLPHGLCHSSVLWHPLWIHFTFWIHFRIDSFVQFLSFCWVFIIIFILPLKFETWVPLVPWAHF
jgi:hypothetical protein